MSDAIFDSEGPHPADRHFQRNEEVRKKHGSPTFYALLDKAANIHNKKSYDYASNEAPYGNYHFAGLLANLFAHSSQDAGFIGRIGEKIYRLSNLEKTRKNPVNESIEDTENDLVVLMALWMADRQDRRKPKYEDEMNCDWDGPSNEQRAQTVASRMEAEQTQLRLGLDKNPLQTELLDLIKLMPDSQTDEILEFIFEMRRIRTKHQLNEMNVADTKARKSL